jgi:hypothetical membrane protein
MATQASVGPVRTRPQENTAAFGDLRVPGVLLFLVGFAFITVTMLLASIVPAYDYQGAAISDLGVTAESALWFNILLVVIGVLNIAGGYLYWRSHRRAWLLALYLVAGIGTVGAGLFPLNTGGLHTIFALTAFVFYNLEGLGTATVMAGPMRVLGIIAGAVGLVYTVVMAIGDSGNPAIFGPIGHGGTERMIAYPVMLWLVALGGYLMAQRADDLA